MMKEKRKGLLQRGIMVAVSALTIVAGAGTVLAYEAMPSSDINVKEDISGFSSFEFVDFKIDVNEADFSTSDTVFITLDGVEIPVYDFSTHALCTHSMVDGYLQVHSSNNKGGCTVTTYTCQRCKKCGYLANSKYYSTTTYVKCPH